ncbi:hypothetical protein [Bartonella sp. MM73XJBT]|uniref:hypothetical protein n=1 Tax=Bartonella sp. MM73XJBT TaxID=3019095 RepID=UPI0023615F53|nr:hypothetical protein [Bartonella sp. MM73XJBT]
MRAALVLCCVVVGDKQAWCDVLWGRMGVWEKGMRNVGWGFTNMSKAWGGVF